MSMRIKLDDAIIEENREKTKKYILQTISKWEKFVEYIEELSFENIIIVGEKQELSFLEDKFDNIHSINKIELVTTDAINRLKNIDSSLILVFNDYNIATVKKLCKSTECVNVFSLREFLIEVINEPLKIADVGIELEKKENIYDLRYNEHLYYVIPKEKYIGDKN